MNKNYKKGITEGWVSGLLNILLFGLKLWAGMVSGSVALVADAWHTLTDSISSIVIVSGMKMASKPPDEEHPYGHGRFEILATIIVGILLILVGVHFIQTSSSKLLHRQEAVFGPIAIIVTIISLIVKEGMARYAFFIAKKTSANSIKADGWHHRSDAISSAVILIGIFFESKLWWIDGALGILVSLIIFYSAFIIIRNTIDLLLGKKPEEEIVKKIQKIGNKIYKGNLRLHHFHVHTYGFHVEMTFHIVLPKRMRLEEARIITQKLFEKIKKEMDILATIHIDTRSKY